MFSLFSGRYKGVTAVLCLYLGSFCHYAWSQEVVPAEVSIGERLFLETRFSYTTVPGDDPAVAVTRTASGDLPGPFRSQSMNCRSCHLVDEHVTTPGGGARAYTDFARRSPITARRDGNRSSTRNAQQMVDITPADRDDTTFHYDGEFTSLEDLVKATLTGRNFGWLPAEQTKAASHIAAVVRGDDGRGQLAREFGGDYRTVLVSTAPDLPATLRLPKKYRIDVTSASDSQILDAIAALISAYVRDIQFARVKSGLFSGSPYDKFLEKNNLPRKPGLNETAIAYSRRLARAIDGLDRPNFVDVNEASFKLHPQQFRFGELELAGLRIFFAESGEQAGNCVRCHSAPVFSDYGFHNTGASQNEYDGVHGSGAFGQLAIPGLKQRKKSYNKFLPATARHPGASGRFRAIADKKHPDRTDLGLWNVYANPDIPGPQQKLQTILCEQVQAEQHANTRCSQAFLLPRTIARVKTPILRNLGHSAPYMHNGSLDSLEQVIATYVSNSRLTHAGTLRNGSPHLKTMRLNAADITALAAFLRSLNEDYE